MPKLNKPNNGPPTEPNTELTIVTRDPSLVAAIASAIHMMPYTVAVK